MPVAPLSPVGETRSPSTGLDLNGNGRTQYKTLKTIGRGTYGWVDEVQDETTGLIYAKKFIQVNTYSARKQAQQQVQQEIEILRKVSEPHIVAFQDAYADRRGFCIIMSPVADCDLAAYYDLCEEKNYASDMLQPIKMWFSCLSAGLSYLHANRIRHKDIKPQNILIKEGNIMFTDFGLAKDFTSSEELTSSTEGYTQKTPMYCSPEAYNEGVRKYPADVFSLGCVFAEMATILTRRSISDFYDFRVTHIDGRESHAFHATIDLVSHWLLLCQYTLLKDFIVAMLSADPQFRPSSQLLYTELAHGHEGLVRCKHTLPLLFPHNSAAQIRDTDHEAVTHSLKIMIAGDDGAGKAGLASKFHHERFIRKHGLATRSSYQKQAIVDGEACMIEVVDIADHREYTALRDQQIRDSDGFILVYSIKEPLSFQHIQEYHNKIMRAKDWAFPQNLPMLLVGAHCEQLMERKVSIASARRLAKELDCGFLEVSSQNNINVNEAFHKIVRQIRQTRILIQQYYPKAAPEQRNDADGKLEDSFPGYQSYPRGGSTTPRLWDRLLGKKR